LLDLFGGLQHEPFCETDLELNVLIGDREYLLLYIVEQGVDLYMIVVT